MSLKWRFEEFYQENKDKILMNTSYPIDQEAMTQWFDAMMKKPGINQLIAMTIRTHIQHVSFQTFYETLMRVAAEIVNHCIAEQKLIILVVNESILRSPTWVAMLIWPIIRDYTYDLRESSELRHGYDEKRYVAVVVDDVSYSGGKLEPMTIFPCWICVAAMSKLARGKFKKNVVIPKAVMEFDTLWSKIEENHKPFGVALDQLYPIFEKAMEEFNAIADTHIIYFDHKLADKFSTMQYLLATGHVPSQGPTGPLIAGCNANDYNVLHYGYDFDWDRVCPKPFYKVAGISWKGRVFDPDLYITFFDLK